MKQLESINPKLESELSFPENKPGSEQVDFVEPLINFTTKTREWFDDHFQGHPIEKVEPDLETALDRTKHGATAVLKNTTKFLNFHVPLDALAFLGQQMHFKPQERKRIMDGLRASNVPQEQIQNVSKRMTESKDLSVEEKIKLLEAFKNLSEEEISALEWDGMIAAALNGKESLGIEETKIDELFTLKLETLLKKHIENRISAKKLVVDLALLIAIIKGGIVLKPLGAVLGKIGYLAVKVYKAGKYSSKAAKEITYAFRK